MVPSSIEDDVFSCCSKMSFEPDNSMFFDAQCSADMDCSNTQNNSDEIISGGPGFPSAAFSGEWRLKAWPH